MNSIQAEQLRQALAMQGSTVAPPVVFLKTNPMACDSYVRNGKKSGLGFLTKVAGLAAAVIFRKNIAGAFRKVFPSLAKDASNALQGAKGFVLKFKGSDHLVNGWHRYVKIEDGAKKFVKDAFATPSGTTVKGKAKGAWDWIKGLVMKPNVTPQEMSHLSSGL